MFYKNKDNQYIQLITQGNKWFCVVFLKQNQDPNLYTGKVFLGSKNKFKSAFKKVNKSEIKNLNLTEVPLDMANYIKNDVKNNINLIIHDTKNFCEYTQKINRLSEDELKEFMDEV